MSKNDLFGDVLEDELRDRASSPRQRVGGASLRADEFGGNPHAGAGEYDGRLNMLRREEEMLEGRRPGRARVRRLRWRGTFWLLASLAVVCAGALGWRAFQNRRIRVERVGVQSADAARRHAEEERMLRMEQVRPRSSPGN